MKRVATILFSLIVLGHLVQPANAQMRVATSHAKPFIGTAKNNTTVMPKTGTTTPSIIEKGAQPQAVQTDAVSYFQDTTGDNWWIYAPVFNNGPDSLGFLRFGEKLYLVNSDSIGPITVNIGGGQTETHDLDTQYQRVMGLRVSTPSQFKSSPSSVAPRLDSVSLTFFPVSMSTRDSIHIWAVPIEDVQFQDAQGNPTGVYPVPDLFGATNNFNVLGKSGISGSQVTAGDINTLTASFIKGSKGAALGTRKQFGIAVFIDGPDFITDTVGYILDANLQPISGQIAIDTDGTLGSMTGVDGPIQMRTYKGNLDGGNQLWGPTKFQSPIGGFSNFFFAFPNYDPTSGQPTGNYYSGNLVLTSYISGTPTAGVLDHPVNGYSLNDIYPNPISTTAEISYTLGNSGNVSLKMYNQLGQQVGNFIGGMQGQGDHTAAFNVSNLPNGVYYYVLGSGDFTSSKTMVVSH